MPYLRPRAARRRAAKETYGRPLRPILPANPSVPPTPPTTSPAIVVFLAISVLSASALADPAQTGIETVVVTATRIEQNTTETGSAVRIIDADELRTMGFSHAIDAVARAPGVTVNQNGAFGGFAGVRIRGASSDKTLVLIDGVAVNDSSSPAGGYDFARLDTENIERIEILNGPQSTLWGTDAIGGLVSITTKQPEDGTSGNLFAQAGSYDTFRGGVAVDHGGNAGDFRFAATRLDTDGISRADGRNGNTEDDGLASITLSARGGLHLPRGARLDGSLLWNDSQAKFDSFRFGAQGNVGDGDELGKTEELSGKVTLKVPLLNGRLDNLLLVGHAEIDRENLSGGATSFEARGEREVFRYQGTLSLNTHNTLALGAEREESSANQDDSTIKNLFALYEWRPVDTLTLTGGLRSDDHDHFGSETTARFAAAFRPRPNLALRGSWGQGFKAPTLFQTTFFCCGATAANAALRPERSEGIDVGIDWHPQNGAGHLGLTLFRQDTDNMINFSFAIGGYENIDEVETEGIEVSAGWNLTDLIALSMDYAYIRAKEADGTTLPHLPEHSGDLALGFDPSGPFSGAILLRFNGREINSDGTRLDDWIRIDINARYVVSENIELFGRVENVFDAHYQQILGYGTPGLSGSLGLRWRF